MISKNQPISKSGRSAQFFKKWKQRQKNTKQRFFAEVAEVVPSEDGHFGELLFPVQGLPLAAGAQAGALQVCRVRPVRLSAAVPEVPRGGLAAGGGAEGGRTKGGCNQ